MPITQDRMKKILHATRSFVDKLFELQKEISSRTLDADQGKITHADALLAILQFSAHCKPDGDQLAALITEEVHFRHVEKRNDRLRHKRNLQHPPSPHNTMRTTPKYDNANTDAYQPMDPKVLDILEAQMKAYDEEMKKPPVDAPRERIIDPRFLAPHDGGTDDPDDAPGSNAEEEVIFSDEPEADLGLNIEDLVQPDNASPVQPDKDE